MLRQAVEEAAEARRQAEEKAAETVVIQRKAAQDHDEHVAIVDELRAKVRPSGVIYCCYL
jgi:hypothetical protein